jgi:hypothetical protein
MAVIDLVNIVNQRLNDITSQNPTLTVDEIYLRGETGLWGLITKIGIGGKTIELDIIESDISWKREQAAKGYAWQRWNR